MTFQDVIAIACVICAAVFLFRRTIAGPLLKEDSKACGSGCGKCAAASGPGSSRHNGGDLLVRIGSMGTAAEKPPGR